MSHARGMKTKLVEMGAGDSIEARLRRNYRDLSSRQAKALLDLIHAARDVADANVRDSGTIAHLDDCLAEIEVAS